MATDGNPDSSVKENLPKGFDEWLQHFREVADLFGEAPTGGFTEAEAEEIDREWDEAEAAEEAYGGELKAANERLESLDGKPGIDFQKGEIRNTISSAEGAAGNGHYTDAVAALRSTVAMHARAEQAAIDFEKDRLEAKAQAVREDEAMTAVPADANAEEILAAGLEAARQAVLLALKDRDTRKDQDIAAATGLLDAVREAITKAEDSAKERLEKDRLEAQATAVRESEAMTVVPVDANAEEILAAGLEAARQAVLLALKDRDTRKDEDIANATVLLDAVREAITKAEDSAKDRLEKDRLEAEATAIRENEAMTAVPADANAEETLAAGLEAARQAVLAALKDRDTRKDEDIANATGLLDAVREAITKAEDKAKERIAYTDDFTGKGVQADVDAANVILSRGADADIEDELHGFAEKHKEWDDFLKETPANWLGAKSALDALQSAAKKLVAQDAARNSYAVKYVGVKAAVDRAELIVGWNGAVDLAEDIAEYVKARNPHKAAVADHKWGVAEAAVPALGAAAIKLNQTYDEWYAYDNEFSLIAALYFDALELVQKACAPETETNSFWKANNKMMAAERAKKWTEAEAAVADVKVASQALVDLCDSTANPDSAAFYVAFTADIRDKVEKARKALQARDLRDLIRAFKDKEKNVNDKINAGDWTGATAGIAALKVAAENLANAKAQSDLDKAAFDTEWEKIDQAELAAVREIAGDPPAKLQAAVDKFLKVYEAANDTRISENWVDAKANAVLLKAAVAELLTACDTFNNEVTEPDIDALRLRLTNLEPKTNTANEVDVPPFIDKLQNAVTQGVTDVTKLISPPEKDYAAAEVRLNKLEKDADLMINGKAQYADVLSKIALVEGTDGEDGKARKAIVTPTHPTPMVKACNEGLDAVKTQVLAAADVGLIAEALRRIEVWKVKANGWQAAAAEAAAAHATLHSPPPDPVKLRELIAKPGGEKVLDDVMATLGEKPRNDLMKIVFKERFGVTLELVKDSSPKPAAKGSKSVKKIYELMALSPAYVGSSSMTGLLKFTRDTTKQEAGWYRGSDKKIFLNCGRAGGSEENTMGDPFELPDIEPDCLPAGTPKSTFFDWTAEHEIGHAVDDGSKYSEAGWNDYGSGSTAADAAVQAAVDHFVVGSHKFPSDKIKELLTNPPSKPYNTPPPKPSGADEAEWNAKWKEVVDWCYDGRSINMPWSNGTRAKTRAIGGTVYHESYEWGSWVSYSLSARTKGITGYQFRAPGEWFSELYAAYRCQRLKPSHPAVAWLKNL